MTRKEKLALLVKIIEIEVSMGIDISFLVGKPISAFNFTEGQVLFGKLKAQFKDLNGYDYE